MDMGHIDDVNTHLIVVFLFVHGYLVVMIIVKIRFIDAVRVSKR